MFYTLTPTVGGVGYTSRYRVTLGTEFLKFVPILDEPDISHVETIECDGMTVQVLEVEQHQRVCLGEVRHTDYS